VRCSTAPRHADFVDVAALVARFGLERLCDLATEKDSGFSWSVLVDMLGSFRRFAPDELALSAHAYDDLAQSVEAWRNELATAQQLIESREPEVEL
jgi:hypothetical protein